jgi:hypothetical protein
MDLIAPVIGKVQAQTLIDFVDTLEKQKSLGELSRLLQKAT